MCAHTHSLTLELTQHTQLPQSSTVYRVLSRMEIVALRIHEAAGSAGSFFAFYSLPFHQVALPFRAGGDQLREPHLGFRRTRVMRVGTFCRTLS